MLVRAMTMMAIDWKTIGLSLPRIAVSNHSDNTNDISRSFFLLQNRNSPEPAREAAPPDAPWPRRRRRYFLRDRSAAARGPGLSRDRAHRSLARCLAAEVQVDAQGGELMGREREREREREGREREGRGGEKIEQGFSTGDLNLFQKKKKTSSPPGRRLRVVSRRRGHAAGALAPGSRQGMQSRSMCERESVGRRISSLTSSS